MFESSKTWFLLLKTFQKNLICIFWANVGETILESPLPPHRSMTKYASVTR